MFTFESKQDHREWYWLIGGGPMQINAMKYIKNLGFGLIVTDLNSECEGSKIADLFFAMDTQDWQNHLVLMERLLLENIGQRIKGVSCIATDCHFTVAQLAASLKLPGISPGLSSHIGNKWQLRNHLKEIEAKQPNFLLVGSELNLAEIQRLVYKFVEKSECSEFLIKPLGLSASSGLKSFNRNYSENLWAELSESLKSSMNSKVLVEEKLKWDGIFASEASIETIVQQGRVQYINMVDRIFKEDLKFIDHKDNPKTLSLGVEFGHINPTSRSPEEISVIILNLQKLIDHLKLKSIYKNETFILKADIYFSNMGPIILEATPRTSGGWDSSYSSLIRGLKIQELAVNISLGKSVVIPNGSPQFVAVISNATESFIDCKGRIFYGGDCSPDRFIAVQNAYEKKRLGLNL